MIIIGIDTVIRERGRERVCDILRDDGLSIGQLGKNTDLRLS